MGNRLRTAIFVYVVFAGSALGWAYLRGNRDLYHHPEPWFELTFPLSTGLAVALGVATAGLAVLSTRMLVQGASWARRLHHEFGALLGPLDRGQIALLACASGLGEEMFFRGALQPALGLTLSSVIFGLVHVGPGRAFIPWTLWATAMGFVFAALFACTGELLAPITAHVLINYVNMRHIVRSRFSPPLAGLGALSR